jgi:hypothetical protein
MMKRVRSSETSVNAYNLIKEVVSFFATSGNIYYLMMYAISYSETSVAVYQRTWRNASPLRKK